MLLVNFKSAKIVGFQPFVQLVESVDLLTQSCHKEIKANFFKAIIHNYCLKCITNAVKTC